MTNSADIVYSKYLCDTKMLAVLGRIRITSFLFMWNCSTDGWNTFLCINKFSCLSTLLQATLNVWCAYYVLWDLWGGGVDRGEGDAGVGGAQAQFSGRGGEQVSQCGALLCALGHQRWSFTVQSLQSISALFLHLPYSWLLILCRMRQHAGTLTTQKKCILSYATFMKKSLPSMLQSE